MHLLQKIVVACAIPATSVPTFLNYQKTIFHTNKLNFATYDFLNNATYRRYLRTSFIDIFPEQALNPGSLYRSNKAEIDYTWRGSWSTPSWGELRYRFDGSYAFLMYMLLWNNHLFLSYVNDWIKQSRYSVQLKMALLNALIFDTLKIQWQGVEKLRYYSQTNNFVQYQTFFTNVFNAKKTNLYYIIKSSLFYKILDMDKSHNAQWIDHYWQKYRHKNVETWDLTYDQAYDAGLNFFVDFHAKNPQTLAQILYQGGSWSLSNQRVYANSQFHRPKEFTSERTSGGRNYLSWVKNEGNGKLRNIYHRPGKNVGWIS